ncbi:hypothetical protein ABT174_18095 [Streptomyces sparsogenes]|uniref:hypothetical protein n=1 Tax=Streptomyces sparsogenes TaxID=67365 RepID=UPI00333337DE
MLEGLADLVAQQRQDVGGLGVREVGRRDFEHQLADRVAVGGEVVDDAARRDQPANALPQAAAPAIAAPIVTYLGGYRVLYLVVARIAGGGGGAGGADQRGGLAGRSDRHRAPASRAVQTLG